MNPRKQRHIPWPMKSMWLVNARIAGFKAQGEEVFAKICFTAQRELTQL